MSDHNPDFTPIQLSFDGIEEWRDLPNFIDIYQVSDKGNIRRIKKAQGVLMGRLLKRHINRWGYEMVALSYRGKQTLKTVHSLVMLAFIGPRIDDNQINHKDGNKRNNCLENLEYCTRAENYGHAIRTGLRNPNGYRGSRNGAAKLTEEQVREIKLLLRDTNLNYNEIAYLYNVDRSNIGQIKRGVAWTHVKLEDDI